MVISPKEVVVTGKIGNKTQKQGGEQRNWELVLEKASYEENNRSIPLEGSYLLRIALKEEPLLGQWIRVKAVVSEWEEVSNPGQFDLGKWYHSRGIMGEFRKGEILQKTAEYSSFKETLWQFRNQCKMLFFQHLGEKEGSVISAMILGEKENLDDQTKERYEKSGISHVLAISGLHLTLLGMGIFRILKLLFPWGRVAEVLAAFLMMLYCILSGASISTIRATIMFIMTLTAKTVGRTYDSLTALALAAVIQLLDCPYAMENSGFLLSFLAVAGVTYVAEGLQLLMGGEKKKNSSLIISISASLTTLPVLLVNYGVFCWYGIFLNLLILPPMSILLGGGVVLLLFSYLVSLGVFPQILTLFLNFLAFILKIILRFYEVCCQIFEQLPFQDGYLGRPSDFQILVYYLSLFLLIFSIKSSIFQDRYCNNFWKKIVLLLLVSFLTLQFPKGFQITMLDVGQGDCVIIQNTNGNVYLSDCGSSNLSKVGKYRLLPFLKEKGYSVIRGVFVSHLDQDHYNGIVELFQVMKKEKIKVKTLVVSQMVGKGEEKEKLEELLLLAEKNQIQVLVMKEGDYWKDKSLSFTCLAPGEEMITEDANSNSMVLQVDYGEFCMLLTGDVEKEGEDYLLSKLQKEGKKYDVLKVAHHGSAGGTREEFLQEIEPKVSLISCGKNNSYGHPAPEVIERLQKQGCRILDTRETGAITIFPKENGRFRIECFKEE